MLFSLLLSTIILLTKIECHTASNKSDVIRKHTGHVDADDTKKKIFTEKNIHPIAFEHTTLEYMTGDDRNEDVVFVPNEKESPHTDDDDRNFGDTVRNKEAGQKEKETTAETNIMFISGKNNDNSDYEKNQNSRPVHNDFSPKPEKNKRKPVLDCTNLECNNTVNSVCGGKMENSKWKYRIFLNECYFRKVNCGFKYEINRYVQVSGENCRNVGHHNAKPYFFKPILMPIVKPDSLVTVRNASARRSLHIDLDGIRCPHPCPVTCTNAYEPECAVTSTGERRVFLNHCKLDYNSCVNRILWSKKPMSECVGHRKADMTQNRAFINWMQKVGIVDNKGRLSLS